MATLSQIDLNEITTGLDKPVVILFRADWCHTCCLVNPEVKALQNAYQDSVVIEVVDVDQHPELSKHYNITRIPTLLFFNAGTLVYRHVGAAPLSFLSEKLEQLQANVL